MGRTEGGSRAWHETEGAVSGSSSASAKPIRTTGRDHAQPRRSRFVQPKKRWRSRNFCDKHPQCSWRRECTRSAARPENPRLTQGLTASYGARVRHEPFELEQYLRGAYSRSLRRRAPEAMIASEIVTREQPASERERIRVLHLHSGNLHGGIETFLRTIARHRIDAPQVVME